MVHSYLMLLLQELLLLLLTLPPLLLGLLLLLLLPLLLLFHLLLPLVILLPLMILRISLLLLLLLLQSIYIYIWHILDKSYKQIIQALRATGLFSIPTAGAMQSFFKDQSSIFCHTGEWRNVCMSSYPDLLHVCPKCHCLIQLSHNLNTGTVNLQYLYSLHLP